MDLARLSWDAVDLTAERPLIIFVQGKTGSKIVVPINSALAEHILSIAGDSTGPIRPVLSRTPPTGRDGLSQQFISLMREAGIDPQSVKTSKNQFSAKTLHTLRHTFVSGLANAGVPVELRMKLAASACNCLRPAAA